jgi:hypothetical protein
MLGATSPITVKSTSREPPELVIPICILLSSLLMNIIQVLACGVNSQISNHQDTTLCIVVYMAVCQQLINRKRSQSERILWPPVLPPRQ